MSWSIGYIILPAFQYKQLDLLDGERAQTVDDYLIAKVQGYFLRLV
jgi:hypothetical protein